MVDVLPSEEDLGHSVVVLGEQPVVGVHQLALSHGGGRLLAGHVSGPAGQIQLAHPHADGAGGHQDDLVSCILQVGEHLDQLLHMADVQPPRGMRQSGGAHLDHDLHSIKPLYSAREPEDRAVPLSSLAPPVPYFVPNSCVFS